MRRRTAGNQEQRLQYLESRIRTHYVDIQRLWKRAPQPDDHGRDMTSPQVPDPFNEPLSGGPPSLPGTGGTRRCSKGIAVYQQCRWAGRARDTVGQGGTRTWENPTDAEGPPDNVGAECSMSLAGPRSRWLVLDHYGFQIPLDANLAEIRADLYFQCAGTPGSPTPGRIHNVISNQFGTDWNNSSHRKFGPWFHRSGIRFAGHGSGYLESFNVTSPFSGVWREQTYFSHFDPSPIDTGLMSEQDPLTMEEINSNDFGVICQFKWPDGGQGGTNPVTGITMHVDAVRICVTYSIYHETGSCSEAP
jgi:hypothetical protein